MSIPPLVCSTPPPPDQCEEDKDPDDFDIPYNLSQDDDDENGFGYGDYSSYNHFQSNIANKNESVSDSIASISIPEPVQVNEHYDSVNHFSENMQEIDHNFFGTNTIIENKQKSEEDVNIEDLDLEINEEALTPTEKGDEKSVAEACDVEISEKVSEVTDDTSEELNTQSSPCEEAASIEHFKERCDDVQVVEPSQDIDLRSNVPDTSSNDEICENEIEIKAISESLKETNLDEDDFGDFDDFQFASSGQKPLNVLETCENPWDSSDLPENDNFGNFTANFDAIDTQTSSIQFEENTATVQAKNELTTAENIDDDFGDFDDFKSSTVENVSSEVTEEIETEQSLPVLNFHTSDSEHQVMESITQVLTSIFEEEISEPVGEFEGNLESMLSETWEHLRETDVRQPYIVNWNNSLGQKTLLKALCIDSRNILFGPKWGYNMPKYAVNLSAAPLQPQKPLTPLNPAQSEAASDKTAAKTIGWTDPFTADGQEFTYAEALLLDLEHLMATLDQMAHNHSTLKISELLSQACNTESQSVVEVTSTDLDVFEAAISTKPDKIYSTTLNVQPLRQISLPDTHIFTPTDSETPTSKTVHYDSGPPILLPQTVLESGKKEEQLSVPPVNDASNAGKDDDDYWEFQDFKSSTDKTSTATTLSQPPPESKTDNAALKPNITYQTQVLQPIKMEPLMPTVNWPAPGEIKETFDDFSDFVSNSAWNEKSQSETTAPAVENASITEPTVTDKIIDKHKNMELETEKVKVSSQMDFDDDFDTFQSALPPKHISPKFNFDNLGSNTYNNIPLQNSPQVTDFNNTFPKVNSVKAEVISGNPTRQNEALTSNTQSNSSEPIPKNSNNLLQPIPTSSNTISPQNQQKSGQILQPLSLESYSQINWPNPGIDLQDLSRFNPVETLQSLKSDLSVGGPSKVSSPAHISKSAVNNQIADEDIWGEFVSSRPKQQATTTKKAASFVDDDEWTDFVSSPSVKPQNGLNTISLNVHTNSNIQKSSNINKLPTKSNQMPLDIPTLNYITPKTSHNSYNDRHFQNL